MTSAECHPRLLLPVLGTEINARAALSLQCTLISGFGVVGIGAYPNIAGVKLCTLSEATSGHKQVASNASEVEQRNLSTVRYMETFIWGTSFSE